MNKQARTAIPQRAAQGGFTLIELIVVIVILGILAATALPKFSNLSGDARLAALNAARGSIATVSAVAHGQALLNPSNAAANGLNYEGTTVSIVNGYPAANNNTATAAGLNDNDFKVYTSTQTNGPTVPANSFIVQPAGIANTTAGAGCFVTYTQATTGGQPNIVISTTDPAAC